MRVKFDEDALNNQDLDIVDHENILDNHELLCPLKCVPNPCHIHQKHTNKHKVMWDNAAPASDETVKADPHTDFEDSMQDDAEMDSAIEAVFVSIIAVHE